MERDKTSGASDVAHALRAPSHIHAQARYDAFMAKRARSEDDSRLELASYAATIEPLEPKHQQMLHELTVSVFWPHRAHDLELFLALGHGYMALDAIRRPLGAAMYFPMGDDFAMCGMMVTTPRLQAQGTGQRLLRRIMRDCDGRDLQLSATRSGYRLYESAGFTPVATIWQQQGIVRPFLAPTPLVGHILRPFAPTDTQDLHRLDTQAFGANRQEVLDAVIPLSSGTVIERDGALCGYALMRNFGKGIVIGPVVAEDDAMAMQLVAPLIQQCEGKFARLDTPMQSEAFKAFLSAAGLGVFDTVTEMYIGRSRRTEAAATAAPAAPTRHVYGLVSHSLG